MRESLIAKLVKGGDGYQDSVDRKARNDRRISDASC